MGVNFNILRVAVKGVRHYGVHSCRREYKCRVLVVGGGTGGCSMAWRFSRRLGQGDVIVVEPSKVHYYQPMFTLVAAGIKKFSESMRPEKSVLPPSVRWIQDSVADFDPCNSCVYTSAGDKINYDFMVVAVGLVNNYDEIPGLKRALDEPASGVATAYDRRYCGEAWRRVSETRGGAGVFSFPRAPAKCSGAALKTMFLAHDCWTKKKVRHLTSITYNTGGPSLFGVPKYRATLERVAERKRIAVNCGLELTRLEATGAVFTDNAGQCITFPFSFLHVTPPMRPPASLRGALRVHPRSLQHAAFANVFGVGDCLCTPNGKTAAAVARQSGVVEHNLMAVMFGKEPTASYDGYGACPLLTSYSTGILAEYVYGKKPCETFPIDQSKERRFFYYLNTMVLPYIYWNKLIKGKWDGPAKIRRLVNPFGK